MAVSRYNFGRKQMRRERRKWKGKRSRRGIWEEEEEIGW